MKNKTVIKKKRNKKLTWGIVLVVFGGVGLTTMTLQTVMFSLLLLACGITLLYFYKKEKSNSPKITDALKNDTDYNLLPEIAEDSVLVYEYDPDLSLTVSEVSLISGSETKPIIFKQEPENPHDDRAVAVYLDNRRIGYIHRGGIQDMYNDYVTRGWLVLGYINRYSVPDCWVTYKIGFYKPLSRFKKITFECIAFTDNISSDNNTPCHSGDWGSVLFKSKNWYSFCVKDKEIATLPKTTAQLLDDSNYKKVLGKIDTCEIRSNHEYAISVTLYLVK